MRRGVWLGAAVLWMVFIWSNSLQTAAESSANSQGFLSLLMPLLEWTNIPEDSWHTLIRKAAHMAEFALLGFLWSNALRDERNHYRPEVPTQLCCALLICLLTALTVETIQLFVAGRSGEVRDIWIDFGGGVLGCLTAGVIQAIKTR